MTEIHYIQWEMVTGKVNRFNAVLDAHSVADGINEWDMCDRPSLMHDNITCYKCICSTDIEKLYYIRNRLNNHVLLIGSECINKFGIDQMISVHNIKKKTAAYSGDKRMYVASGHGGHSLYECPRQTCSNFKISQNTPYHVTQCKSCCKSEASRVSPVVYGKAINNRQCTVCK